MSVLYAWGHLVLIPHHPHWSHVFLLTVPACRASFMVKIIESIKRDSTPKKECSNSLHTITFPTNTQACLLCIQESESDEEY